MSLPEWVTGKPQVAPPRMPMHVRTAEGHIVLDTEPGKQYRLEPNGMLRSAFFNPRGKAFVKKLKKQRREPRRVSRQQES